MISKTNWWQDGEGEDKMIGKKHTVLGPVILALGAILVLILAPLVLAAPWFLDGWIAALIFDELLLWGTGTSLPVGIVDFTELAAI